MTRAQTVLLFRAAMWAEQMNRTPGQLNAYLSALDVASEIDGDESTLYGAIDYAERLFGLKPKVRQRVCCEMMTALGPHIHDFDGWTPTEAEQLPALPRVNRE